MEDIDEGRLLEVFKGCVQSLLREKDSQRVILDDTPNSQLLCFLLGMSKDGIKKTFFGSGTLFDLVDNLPSCIPGTAVIQLLNTIKDLSKNSIARSRLFIRLALNEGDFVDYISSLIWNEELLKKYYMDNAIVRNEESVSIFLMLLEPLKTAQFKLFPLAKELEIPNYWETFLDKKSLDSLTRPLLSETSISKPIPMMEKEKKLAEATTNNSSVSSNNGSISSNSIVGSLPNNSNNNYGEEIDIINKNKRKSKKTKKKNLVSIQDASDPNNNNNNSNDSSSISTVTPKLPINEDIESSSPTIISNAINNDDIATNHNAPITIPPTNNIVIELPTNVNGIKKEAEEEEEVEEEEDLGHNLSASADEIQEILNKLDDDLNIQSEYMPYNSASVLPPITIPSVSTTTAPSIDTDTTIMIKYEEDNTVSTNVKENKILSVYEEVKSGVIKDTSMSYGEYKIWKSVIFIMKTYIIYETYIKEVGVEEAEEETSKNSRDNWMEEYYAKLYLDSPAKASNSLSKSKYCAGNCGNTLNSGILKKANYCNYTCLYYCDSCHKNEKSVIPSKLVLNWDRNEYTVAILPKKYLDKCQSKPLINLNVLNPNLYEKITILDQIKNLRSRLILMGEFIKTCRNSHNLLDQLGNRKYLLDSVHVFSTKDLIECKALMSFIMNIMEAYVIHITEKCETCKGKGFYCEICKSNELLFSFQIRKISKCPVCKALYHNSCVKKQGYSWKCIKCSRRDQLNQRKSNNSL